MSLDSLDIANDTLRRASRRPSTLINRNVTVAGHRTSVRLEAAMWDALYHVCERERKSLNDVVTEIARDQVESSLTAAIRVYVMSYFRAAASRSAA
ncbi:MAG: ribbon-helix-helix domain-containing protein [Stellaceae bacterium]